MPKPIDEDRARRKELLEQKRAARRAAKVQRETEKKEELKEARSNYSSIQEQQQESKKSSGRDHSNLLELPEDAIRVIFSVLPAADLGRLTLSCKRMNQTLPAARVSYLVSRLSRPHAKMSGRVGFVDLCRNEAEARELLEQSYGGGETGHILPPKSNKYAKKQAPNEFVAYARFLEEAISGYGALSTGNSREPILLPRFVQGRFASVSPEHSLCRIGGGATSGAGGSGVASWGVGKRGQLGHGKRQDERQPCMLMGGLGYTIRIVQVSAGGGLVRVSHSLLLTSTGRVLSFGSGQYGALGHGYSAAKQLPDILRPQYVDALKDVRCICVAAGELHSAVVTSDGDVYTWGDGFCGQLGHGDKRPQVSPRQVTLGGLEDECVASISCGSRHTLAVTEDGEVWSWGLGHFGVLGRSFTPFDYDADAAVVAFTAGEANNQPFPAAIPDVVAPGARLQEQDVVEGQGRDHATELMAHLDLIANLSLDDSSDQCIPKVVDSLEGIKIVGSSAGHRHSLFLAEDGSLYSCGAGKAGCLGHGDTSSQMHPMKITAFDEDRVRIMQMSAGVDMSMAVSTTGEVYAWGKTDGGRIGLGLGRNEVKFPRKVQVTNTEGVPVKAVDVECGYVHSLIVGLDGTLHLCGGVGVEGEADGQEEEEALELTVGMPRQVRDFNIWHRVPEPKEKVKKERWKKFGKYEVKGRSKMMAETHDHNL